MIVITNVDFYEVKGDWDWCNYSRQRFDNSIPICMTKQHAPVLLSEHIEHIRGRRLVSADGREIVLGLDSATAEILGMQQDAWDAMESRLDSAINRLAEKECVINAAKKASFFTRLKWLINGFCESAL